MGMKAKHIGGRQEFYKRQTFLQIILMDGFAFQRNELCALIASFLWYYKRLLLDT